MALMVELHAFWYRTVLKRPGNDMYEPMIVSGHAEIGVTVLANRPGPLMTRIWTS